MNPRETWHGLQSHLSAARAHLEAGNHARALAEADAALAIDSHFLAAQSLRERILAAAPNANASPYRSPLSVPLDTSGAADPLADLPLRPKPIQPPPAAETGYAKFEQRAKRRRVDRRLDAARAAIAQRRLHEAVGALEEVRDLDPNAPELPELTAALEHLRGGSAAPRRGAWLAAALVFGGTIFAASWLEENQHALLSHPMLAISDLVATPPQNVLPDTTAEPAPAADIEHEAAPESAAAGTSGRISMPLPASRAPAIAPAFEAVSTPPITTPAPVPAAPAQLRTVLPAAAAPSTPTSAAFAPLTASAAPIAPSPPPPDASPLTIGPRPEVDEAALVKQALQRYRVAYDGLDAGSAQAVWPAVNQGALAKAFDGLESQTLTFDDCRVQLQNETATAMCRGTTRYVPKVGSREPRTEPRVWNFSLRKNGSEWKIANARVDR